MSLGGWCQTPLDEHQPPRRNQGRSISHKSDMLLRSCVFLHGIPGVAWVAGAAFAGGCNASLVRRIQMRRSRQQDGKLGKLVGDRIHRDKPAMKLDQSTSNVQPQPR
jgi:hypothetical protein